MSPRLEERNVSSQTSQANSTDRALHADGEPGVAVSAEMLRPPHELTLPCCNVFRIRDGLVSGDRLCVDINPVNE
jgi:hypothetical protein